jgi:uncharacterized protein YkwD
LSTAKYLALFALLAPALGATCDTQTTGDTVPVFTGPGNNQNGNTNNSTNTPPPADSTPSISASLLEQLSLERINRARLRPGAEASKNGIAIDEGIPGALNTSPKPAVALNSALKNSARAHSLDMLNNDYFEHNSLNGDTPFDRMEDEGFVFRTAGENLAWRGTTGSLNETTTVENQHVDLFVDSGIANRGHRVTMLNRNFREVGISIVRGQFTKDGTTYDSLMQTQDFATSVTDQVFVLGVVYQDRNSNTQYDYGEGTANSTVTLGSVSKSTNSAGGYSFAVSSPGDYVLRFANGQSVNLTIDMGTANIKVDMVTSQLVVNLGLGQLD